MWLRWTTTCSDKMILNGGELTVHTSQYITHSQALTGPNPLASVTWGCSRLKQIFWSFERAVQPVGITAVNDFYHPLAAMGVADNAVSDQKNYEVWWQIGSQKLSTMASSSLSELGLPPSLPLPLPLRPASHSEPS